MNPGPTMERVYDAIRIRVRGGGFQPGEHIDPNRLSIDLLASVTPVRDALHRLEGERLIESQHPIGFRMPMASEPNLRDQLHWSAALLAFALQGAGPDAVAQAAQGFDAGTGPVADATAILFSRIVGVAANHELHAAMTNLSDRLHVVRLAETSFLPDGRAELAEIVDTARAAALPELRRLLQLYHRRRLRLVPDLIAAVRPRPHR